MVPEFMHRDFYRSHEGDFEAVQTKTRAKPVKPQPSTASPKEFRGTPLRSAARAEAPEPREETLSGDTVAVPLESLRSRSEADDSPPAPEKEVATAVPRPVETRNLNVPLVLCLLFVVGLFLWREQTRPVVPVEASLPIPKRAPATGEVAKPTTVLGEDNPYPGMTPVPEAPITEDSAAETAAPIPPVSETEGEVATPSEEAAPMQAQEPDHTTYPSPETAAQRAAILERVSDRTVNRNERDRRMERDLEEDSLFPETSPEVTPDPAPPTRPDSVPPAEPKETAEGDSLFPEEAEALPAESALQPATFPAEAAPVSPPPVTSKPATGPSASKAKPPTYQIAEPQL